MHGPDRRISLRAASEGFTRGIDVDGARRLGAKGQQKAPYGPAARYNNVKNALAEPLGDGREYVLRNFVYRRLTVDADPARVGSLPLVAGSHALEQ
jgi:hypothetical protein